MKVALAGNPNSGKTSIFNLLTGKNEKVGNWAGVTVEKIEGKVKRKYARGNSIVAVDLPGTYSLSPFTGEEAITSEFVKSENPDVIINIVDATNLGRSLFLTTQLLELGIPVVVALNKSDIIERKDVVIDIALLSKLLGSKVLTTVGNDGSAKGLGELIQNCIAAVNTQQTAPYKAHHLAYHNKADAEADDRLRFDFVNSVVEKVETKNSPTFSPFQDKLDQILTNKWVGIPLFAIVMFAVFWISQAGPGVWLADMLTAWLESGQAALASLISGANPLLYELLINGVVGGVIAVIGFLPLVMVMYFLLALLEDCGYMARVSVILDPIFKKVGLSGKSVIAFVVGTGCAVPAVMSCRTIKNERERRATALLAPFMPCGAKLPIIALFAGAFFGGATWVGPLMYFVGIAVIFLSALLINRITGVKAKKSYFIIELPAYKMPSLWSAVKSMCNRGWSFIVKAATIILICNTVVQLMQSFTWSFTAVPDGQAELSILATIAKPLSYLIVPVIGIASWQLTAAAVTGFIAKENVVGTIAVCFAVTNAADADFGISSAAALAYMMFNLFTPPCFAAIGAMRSELKSVKWLIGGIALQLAVGFTVSFLVYQVGTLITSGTFGTAFFPGLIAIIIFGIIATLLSLSADSKAPKGE